MQVRSLLICLAFLSTTCYGQFDFVGDSTYEKKTTKIDSLFGLSKQYDFEFRLYSIGTFPPHHSLFVLTVTDSIFVARCFRMETIDNKYDWVEVPLLNKDKKALWKVIYKNYVFSLPSFNKILKDHPEVDINFRDGISYSIEYSSSNKKNGAQGYRCANSSSRIYPGIKEFKWLADIIMIVYDFIGKDWKPC